MKICSERFALKLVPAPLSDTVTVTCSDRASAQRAAAGLTRDTQTDMFPDGRVTETIGCSPTSLELHVSLAAAHQRRLSSGLFVDSSPRAPPAAAEKERHRQSREVYSQNRDVDMNRDMNGDMDMNRDVDMNRDMDRDMKET
ncbi:unnamed protein product [Pleuronectes platessa]|uniref:Uncharacterized protein n=1 Tax=Pleuronectes platessa TaxID=8262 RepID=A0A9N7ULS3_PLEPL|nr:unnamed protein product [Pleuronectes platessa]